MLGRSVAWLTLALVLLTFLIVVLRYLFNVGSVALQESLLYLHSLIFLMGAAYTLRHDSHVRVDIFREMLSHRKQAWFELCGLILFAIPYLSLITYFAIRFVLLSFSQGEGSESLTGIGMRYIIKAAMVFGFLLLWAAFIATMLRLFAYLFGDANTQHSAEGKLAVFAESEELEKHRQELERASAAQTHREAAP